MLLSTVLIHMMSEVRELLGRATRMGSIPKELEFPFAELLICIGKRGGRGLPGFHSLHFNWGNILYCK